jgi:UDP-GlcNAc3NAcA epimerase
LKKILTVVGARPQFIKAAVVSRELRSRNEATEILLHTGQHFDANMSDVFFEELDIPRPDHQLGIHGGSHGEMTGRMLIAIEKILLQERPDMVLVYGDTNSTLAGALASAKLKIPLAHVEAGLRSFNRAMPEELNRVLTDHTADILFSPTNLATGNLLHEGIAPERIHQVGDVMFDAAMFYSQKAEQNSEVIDRLGLSRRGYFLATQHRAENTDNPERLKAIIDSLNEASAIMPVVLPLHPRTREAIAKLDGVRISPNLRIIEPVGYLDMVMLEKHARIIVTDSGGVQKEAYFHHVPCITTRDETEWAELVECGWNQIVGVDKNKFSTALRHAMDGKPPEWLPELYGSGHSAGKIVDILLER